ncbi:MAG: hypothetical protein Q9182_006458, partial [Xanthomendoza sp. 2 TL-2023]
AKVNSTNLDSLRPICKKQYVHGESAPPLVADGVAYYPTWDGLFVALDYAECKVLWQTNVTRIINQYDSTFNKLLFPVSRTTPAMHGNALIIGTIANALLLAINKRNGKLIDKIRISNHPLAIVTQSPTVWQDRIFVGSSSSEELGSDSIPGYVCCSFIGTMNGLVLERDRFKLLWSQSMIPAGLNFSGAAIWGSQPSIDPKRNQVFIATGNVYSVPESYDICANKTANATSTDPGNATDPCAPKEVYQEAILAFDTATGNINWSHQLSPIDAWNAACVPGLGPGLNPGACPDNPGPDADFGMAPTFVPGSKATPSQKDTLIIGQKNGNLYALSASDGRLFWAVATSPSGELGGLIWGVAVDSTAVYYTAVNALRKAWKLQNGISLSNSAFGAASLTDGKILWETPAPANSSTAVQPTVVNDLVLVGVGGVYPSPPFTGIGILLAINKYTGAILKQTTLDAFFQSGIAVVRDSILFGTGYGASGTGNGSFNVWRLRMQYLRVTKNDRMDYGDRAKELAIQVCSRMIAWLAGLPQERLIVKDHHEKGSYGESPFAEEVSIFIDLIPCYSSADTDTYFLNRELAYFAFEALKQQLEFFGAMQGAMDLYAFGFKRGTIIMNVFDWPPDVKAGGNTS